MNRPGAALLQSLIAEERRGRPGAAEQAARAAAQREPDRAPEHLLDAAYALLVAGEPKAAGTVLDEIQLLAGGPEVGRRVRACRSWADQYDHNWYPGNTGAERDEDGMFILDSVSTGDPETVLLEACVLRGPPAQLSQRVVTDSAARQGAAAVGTLIESAFEALRDFSGHAEATGAGNLALWAATAQADLLWRCGMTDRASGLLAGARSGYQQLGDRIGQAGTLLTEGDWYAVPGSSPEALGFDLAQQHLPSVVASAIDHGRAASCYDQAGALLDGVDAPRAHGSLALRRAVLYRLSGRISDQRVQLAAAEEAYVDAGDGAARQVVAVHRVLGDLSGDAVASTRLRAGTGWDLRARGPIAEVLAWANDRGSSSFAAGLGRLLQRAGEAWASGDDLDRAAIAYSMALPLLRLGQSTLPAAVLDAMADVDIRRHFLARALVRLEQSIRSLPPVAEIGEDPLPWVAQVNLITSIVGAESNRATSSVTGVGLSGLERSIERLQALASIDGVPSADVAVSLLRDAPQLLDQLLHAREGANGEGLMGEFATKHMLAITAQAVRDQIATIGPLVALSRGRVALRAGWSAEADRWFTSALEMTDSGEPEHRWTGVLVCVAWGRDDDALSRFKRVRDGRLLPDELLASLALRARDYETAARLFTALDTAGEEPAALSWPDIAVRAELALETNAPRLALTRALGAIEKFESIVATLGRDPDRLALSDDLQATALYVTAARAGIAIAAECERRGELEEQQIETARSFECSDRGHSLALATLVAGAAQAAADDDALRRRWQQSATEWSAAFERLLAAFDENGERHAAEPEAALTGADEELVSLEAGIEASRPGALAAARRLPSPVAMSSVQQALPEEACLLQYHVLGRDLLVWGVSAHGARGHHRRIDAAGLEPLVAAFWRACSTRSRGQEGDELAELLLSPVADLLAACDRVVVVPFGPLAAVPFHALPFDAAPLGAARTISYVPAASLLAGRRLDEPLSETDAVVVGDPAFDSEVHPSLSRLPGAGVEASAVGRLWATDDVLLGPDAQEERLRRLLPDRAVVHLAAHGYLDQIAPSNSSIVLAGDDGLTVSDLIGLRLRSQLAVLSACDSGRGAVTLGGDVVGLTRGLLASGVQRAVVSLWPVDDAPACVTMAMFHERLVDGGVPARALADAQNALRAMSGADIAARYESLGGSASAGARSARRGSGRPVVSGRRLALDPEFVDADAPESDALGELDGALERIWAPFILVGG